MRLSGPKQLIGDLPEWITEKEIEQLLPKVSEEFLFFINSYGIEEDWIELEVGGKFFDLNVWDDDCNDDVDEHGDWSRGECSASIYPTYPTIRNDTGEEWRETDGTDWVTLWRLKPFKTQGGNAPIGKGRYKHLIARYLNSREDKS